MLRHETALIICSVALVASISGGSQAFAAQEDAPKADIVMLGLELDTPLHLTWSCYTGDELACGVCESCGLRLKGFEVAGVVDPIAYAE